MGRVLPATAPTVFRTSFNIRERTDHALDIELIGITVAVDDGQPPHLYVVAASGEPNGAKPPVAPPDADGIVIPAAEGHLLAAELHPVLAAITPLRRCVGGACFVPARLSPWRQAPISPIGLRNM
jgi:hypothetical protein